MYIKVQKINQKSVMRCHSIKTYYDHNSAWTKIGNNVNIYIYIWHVYIYYKKYENIMLRVKDDTLFFADGQAED